MPDGTDAVILALGANDMLRGVDPAVTKKALGDAIRRLRARNIDVMIAGMRAAPNLGADYAKKFDAMYEELAREYGVLLYPFLLDGPEESLDALVGKTLGLCKAKGALKPGDRVVFLAGLPLSRKGTTNVIRVETVQ